MKFKHKELGTIELQEPYPGVFLDQENRYWPTVSPTAIWVNPPGPRFGQVSKGDTLAFILRAFLGSEAEPFSTNVLHFIISKVSGSKQFAAAATGLAKYIFSKIGTAANLAGVYNPNVTFKNPIIRSLNTSTDEAQPTQTAQGGSGGASGSVPLRSGVVVHKGTAKSGRSFAGRMYLPAVDETHQRAGVLDAEVTKRGNAFGASLLNFDDPDDATTGFQLAVYSPSQSKKTNAIVATPVTSTATRGVMGSQRRRQSIS